jgi:hypothetical protein
MAVNGVFDATTAAAPAAGRTLTKVRRVIDLRVDFFMATFGGIQYHKPQDELATDLRR